MGLFDFAKQYSHLAPMNFYYQRSNRELKRPDVLDIVFKDLDTGEKYVESIKKPMIEIYTVKPQYREQNNYLQDFISVNLLNKTLYPYETRKRDVAKLLGINEYDVPSSPHVLGTDIDIRSFYAMEFTRFLLTDESVERAINSITMSYLDIENDVVDVVGFANPGEAPINAVTFIDEPNMECYTFLLRNGVKENEQIAQFEKNISEFKKMLNATYDEIYGHLEYHILMYSDELKMLEGLFKVINAVNNDFIFVWNLPYDLNNLIARIQVLGGDPVKIMCHEAFKYPMVKFEEDTNPNVHKRKHTVDISMLSTWYDQMVLYAGIRSGRSKPPSLKLNAIAQLELKDEKLDYSEEASIKTLPYINYKKFVQYNIKDVLLQMGINRKVKDAIDLYNSMITDGLLPSEVFTSTKMLTNSLYIFHKKKGMIMGNNRNKLAKKMARELKDREGVRADEEDDDLDEDPDTVIFPEYSESEDNDIEMKFDGHNSDVNFQGAIVSNSNRMLSTGTVISGVPNSKVHEHVCDFDVESSYPSSMIVMNLANKTMVGKIVFRQDDANALRRRIELYLYHFIDDEEDGYSVNPATYLMELFAEDQILELGRIGFNLPSPVEFVNMIGEEKVRSIVKDQCLDQVYEFNNEFERYKK